MSVLSSVLGGIGGVASTTATIGTGIAETAKDIATHGLNSAVKQAIGKEEGAAGLESLAKADTKDAVSVESNSNFQPNDPAKVKTSLEQHADKLKGEAEEYQEKAEKWQRRLDKGRGNYDIEAMMMARAMLKNEEDGKEKVEKNYRFRGGRF